MVCKDVGVILRSVRSGETSTLVTFLGRHSGKIRLIGKGALAPSSPFRGLLEVGNVIDVVFYYREGRSLSFLKEIHVVSTLERLRESLPHLATALGILELAEAVCYWESPEARAVDLIAEYVACPPSKDPLHVYLAFEFKLLGILGQRPDFSVCASCGCDIVDGYYHPPDGESLCDRHSMDAPHRVRLDRKLLAYVASVADSGLAQASADSVDPALRKRFGEILHWTYTFHIQGYSLPKALKLLPKDA